METADKIAVSSNRKISLTRLCKKMKYDQNYATTQEECNTKVLKTKRYNSAQNIKSRSLVPAIEGTSECLPTRGLRYTDSFYSLPCIDLAKKLLGKILVRKLPNNEILRGRIVETESYLGYEDEASHSSKGKVTERNVAMFMKPGTSYVYKIYGIYHCFNISSEEEGSAVLIRALEAIEGISIMQALRGVKRQDGGASLKLKELCNGPSKLCQAMKIEKESLNKVDLSVSDVLWVEDGIDINECDIIHCKRIGVDSAGKEWADKPLRFYIRNNPFVSIRNRAAETQ